MNSNSLGNNTISNSFFKLFCGGKKERRKEGEKERRREGGKGGLKMKEERRREGKEGGERGRKRRRVIPWLRENW